MRGAEAKPLLLVAGGTGAAQALAIVDDLTLRHRETPVTLLACADSEADFYFADALGAESRSWLNVELIADPRRDADNAALTWLTAQAQQHRDHRVVLCGSPDFVYAAQDALTRGGLSAERMESDVFAYAPRS